MSDIVRAFPIELLDAGPEARLDFFYDYFVSHLLLEDLLDEILEAIINPGDRLINVVCGAPGIGKTTLAKALKRRLQQIALSDPKWDVGRIAVVASSLASYNNKPFSWRDFYIRLLNEMGEILLPNKIVFDEQGIYYSPGGQIKVEKAVNASTLVQVLEKAIKHRRPLSFVLDEGHHLLKLAHGEVASEQMESFKTLVDGTRCPMVFIGIHKLLEFAQVSGQIDRRMNIFQFHRYDATNQKHVEEFCTVLHNFFEIMPLPEVPDLDDHWDFFFEKSFGEIGVLKDWLYNCLKHVLVHEKGNLTLSICEKKAPSEIELGTSPDKIMEGEADYARIKGLTQTPEEIAARRDALRTLLGLPKLEITTNKADDSSEASDNNDSSTAGPSSKVESARMPGERDPKRDKVGPSK